MPLFVFLLLYLHFPLRFRACELQRQHGFSDLPVSYHLSYHFFFSLALFTFLANQKPRQLLALPQEGKESLFPFRIYLQRIESFCLRGTKKKKKTQCTCVVQSGVTEIWYFSCTNVLWLSRHHEFIFPFSP